MESSGMLLGLLAFTILIGIPALAIMAIVRVGTLKNKMDAETPQLIARIYGLEKRLERIEKALASGAPVPENLQAPESEHAKTVEGVRTPAVAPPPIPTPDAPPSKAQPSVFFSSVTPAPVPSARASYPGLSMPQSSQASTQHDNENFEALVAGRWLNYVGILALLFAVTFFLKYAFDNNWVGPRGRVGIGLLAGSILYPWSHHLLDRGYKYFSEGIAGLGAAVLYLSLWAGWHYYHIFSQDIAFMAMIAVTAVTLVVALGRNSERIAFLALLGGVITPMLVSTGANQEVTLFTYLTILGAGVLGIAWVRDWKSLPPVQFLATLVYFWGWYSDFYRPYELATTVMFATVFFILFAALPVVRSRRDGELSGLEAAIVLVNSLAYLVALRVMLWPENRWALTGAVLALAAVHLAAG